jgi:hypothetical protein
MTTNSRILSSATSRVGGANNATDSKGRLVQGPAPAYQIVLPPPRQNNVTSVLPHGQLSTASLLPHFDTTIPYNPTVSPNLTHVMADTPGNFRGLIIGGDQGNEFYGFGGSDTMVGGKGFDTYHYTSWSDSNGLNTDIIWNFNVSQDKIDISSLTQGVPPNGTVVPIDEHGPELMIIGGGFHYRVTLWDGQIGHVLEINLHVAHTSQFADSSPNEIAQAIANQASWLIY